MKYLKRIIYLVTIPAIGFSITLLTFYFHAGIVLGKLPKYNQPDPKTLEFYENYEMLISFFGNLWVITALLWLLLALIYLFKNRKNIFWKPIVISAFAQGLAIAILFSEITEWFAD
ncbi:hypothetical protein [Tamlana crocina]|uniref:Uncharacterized protein n=1 Tax=Tamlana crocina TaxID=393006 RepID=A0ABX1DFJ8_9FLAO|nr:hypothetical protein [Tamlana crocina]NJX16519.1 hypothetical protein [Tamlana crocina]